MFGFVFRPRRNSASASAAKERLQILLAHERLDRSNSELLPILQREILEVVRRHIKVDGDTVDVRMDRNGEMSTIGINIEIPSAPVLQAS